MTINIGPLTQKQTFNAAVKMFKTTHNGNTFMKQIKNIPEDKLIKLSNKLEVTTDKKLKLIPKMITKFIENKIRIAENTTKEVVKKVAAVVEVAEKPSTEFNKIVEDFVNILKK